MTTFLRNRIPILNELNEIVGYDYSPLTFSSITDIQDLIHSTLLTEGWEIESGNIEDAKLSSGATAIVYRTGSPILGSRAYFSMVRAASDSVSGLTIRGLANGSALDTRSQPFFGFQTLELIGVIDPYSVAIAFNAGGISYGIKPSIGYLGYLDEDGLGSYSFPNSWVLSRIWNVPPSGIETGVFNSDTKIAADVSGANWIGLENVKISSPIESSHYLYTVRVNAVNNKPLVADCFPVFGGGLVYGKYRHVISGCAGLIKGTLVKTAEGTFFAWNTLGIQVDII